jgi:hypothetical protein
MSIQEYKRFCQHKAEMALVFLRDGHYLYEVLNDLCAVTDRVFEDVMALLIEHKFIELNPEDQVVRITNAGRLYLLNEAKGMVHLGDGVVIKGGPYNEGSVSTPKPGCYFKLSLNHRQQRY